MTFDHIATYTMEMIKNKVCLQSRTPRIFHSSTQQLSHFQFYFNEVLKTSYLDFGEM